MKIAIEAQRIFRTNKHGMDFVALEVIRELQKIDKSNTYYILVSPGEDRCLEPTENFHIIEVKGWSYPYWEQVALPIAIAKIKPDLLHCTSNTAPIYCHVPLILTLHDIIFLEPQTIKNKSWYQNMGRIYRRLVVPRILVKCKKIITVSNFECKRISEALHLPASNVVSVYNGFSTHFKPMINVENVTKKYITQKTGARYLFFLGNTDPKKNASRTLKAYSLYLERSKVKCPLLIADLKEPYLNELLKKEGIEHIKSHLAFPGYIPNTDLAAIYNGAFVFLYTSLRESFGIPMLESMACGTPVITGNKSALPEIAGNGGILVDVTSPEAICNKILQLETDPEYYVNQVNYGLQRSKSFSWCNTAKQLLSIYQS
ncbi:MAG: glycosyltransferase family 1 protein [Bacteroidaceae bacterium]